MVGQRTHTKEGYRAFERLCYSNCPNGISRNHEIDAQTSKTGGKAHYNQLSGFEKKKQHL